MKRKKPEPLPVADTEKLSALKVLDDLRNEAKNNSPKPVKKSKK